MIIFLIMVTSVWDGTHPYLSTPYGPGYITRFISHLLCLGCVTGHSRPLPVFLLFVRNSNIFVVNFMVINLYFIKKISR